MRKERISFSFSSKLMWMALSGSSPCRVRTRCLSGSSQALPGPILPSCSPELGWKLRPPSPEDDTLRKARQLALFWDISTLPPVGSSPADASCRQMITGTGPCEGIPLGVFFSDCEYTPVSCFSPRHMYIHPPPPTHMMHGSCSKGEHAPGIPRSSLFHSTHSRIKDVPAG